MTTASSSASSLQQAGQEADPRRWKALGLLGLLQFMLVLDITIVNVALPKIEASLGFTQQGLAWVVSAYVLMAGGFLMLGGRLADIFGRRKLLILGIILFATASALCGAAVGPAMLVTGRFVQGLGEALAAPAALSLIALLFTDPGERTKALGIWGGLTGIGGILGYIISGVLTTWVSWRWIFYINIPVAIIVLIILPGLIAESKMIRDKAQKIDFTGALTVTLGMVGIVYGLLQAAEHPWGSTRVLVPLIGGVLLLLLTVFIESRSHSPLIPMEFFRNRSRTVANVVALLFMAAFIPYTFMLTLFEQQVLHFSPMQSGLSYLPLGIGIGMGIGISTGLTPKVGVKAIGTVGFFVAGIGLFLTSNLTPESTYWGGILPGLVLFGVFSGATMPAMTNAALHNVTGQDSGLASGVQSTTQQIGSALGLATLVTLATRYTIDHISTGTAPATAMTDGFALSFRIGAGLLIVCAVLVALLLERGIATVPQQQQETKAPDLAPATS